MEEAPEREASAKLAQHLAVAVQVAEAVIRLRQQRTERQAASTDQAAAGARAERTAQHAADQLAWAPALDPEWTANADLEDLGRAWGAAAGWADTDPTANVAATRAEARLTQMAPAAMARFQELHESGTDRIEAMRDVLVNVAAESRPRVFVAEPAPANSARAATAQGFADTAAYQARQSEHTSDDPATPHVDEHAEGVLAAVPRRDEQAAWQSTANESTADRLTGRRVTPDGYPHPADVAADHYPRPYTDASPGDATGKSAAPAAATTRSKTRTLTR